MIFLSKSPKETQGKARILLKKITNSAPTKTGVVIGLEGELGAGKTVFVKGFARALDIKHKISSPTFVLMKNYKLKTPPKSFATGQANYKLLYHIDAYRLKDHKDLLNLGIKKIISDPKNLILIEWSDRVKKILPKNYIKIHIDHIDTETRKISFF